MQPKVVSSSSLQIETGAVLHLLRHVGESHWRERTARLGNDIAIRPAGVAALVFAAVEVHVFESDAREGSRREANELRDRYAAPAAVFV